MPRTILVIACIAALMISGCSSPSTPEPLKTALPSPVGEVKAWTIRMTHSGGIIGLSRSIDVDSDGTYTVTDDREEKTVTGQLGSDELSKLNDLVTNAAYITMPPPQPSGCADCFVYDILILGNGEKFSVQLDDTSISGSGMETLIMTLRDLMDAALK